jgi:hypothetical protein
MEWGKGEKLSKEYLCYVINDDVSVSLKEGGGWTQVLKSSWRYKD